jgi:hypothetical protein
MIPGFLSKNGDFHWEHFGRDFGYQALSPRIRHDGTFMEGLKCGNISSMPPDNWWNVQFMFPPVN